ncbi:gonadotropin-releasing hormone II receptor-like isoform X1 [Trichoplusia ni]|uniref:Gonadotropin-releasing hormone II receptor-like isoform X1 n=1 Tax=Trichoplusia ni TaxID=7111 RepID=A0A7E5WK60_TRINI|nr:gonadotropin-releasing hormone II receptor-like isoform X1 [Trichoplusia ni]XP_026740727.1 gonadotropin-releasing hormone II receptor-like isoform X1 [Trichoplusia ni]XP_026740735.1 gonadotropin-releasing hormone II receptor-like isoform X1 [Trichoplusia ni]
MDIDEKVSGPGGASQKNWTHLNTSDELPLDMRFNHGHMVSMTVYSVLMVVSATGNLTVLSQLMKRKRAGRASRLDVLLMHLAVADLMVTFLMMPLEIAWAGTVQWLAGDLMCRVMMFTRTFGLYLSSFVLICIAVDRYYAILKPLNVTWEARVRRALITAWVCAGLASLPQSFIFHVEEHPDVKGYYQCVSYGSLPTESHEFAYFLVNMILMYVIPLLSTLYCSSAALLEIIKRANTSNDKMRRSGVGILGRARARTLKMTVTIVLVFFTCWSPYYCYCLWYWIDKDSLRSLDPAIQKAMWLFSCTNSCANPIVYGVFNRNRWSWRAGRVSYFNVRCRSGSMRRGSRLPYGESMEISAATLARARNSLGSDRNGRRDSAYNTQNGSQKHWNTINNNHVSNGMV